MKIKYKVILLVLIILIFILFIIKFTYYYQQNKIMLELINNNDYNKFVSALGYLNELDQRLTEWQEIKLIKEEDLDYDLISIQIIIRDFKEIIHDYNTIYSEEAYFPYTVEGWFQEFRNDLIKLKNKNDSTSSIIKLTTEDLNNLGIYHDKIKQINMVSKNTFSFDYGSTNSSLEKISKKGFIIDMSWMKWLQQIESIILSNP